MKFNPYEINFTGERTIISLKLIIKMKKKIKNVSKICANACHFDKSISKRVNFTLHKINSSVNV